MENREHLQEREGVEDPFWIRLNLQEMEMVSDDCGSIHLH